jgi:surface protein
MRKLIRKSPISYNRRIKGQATPVPWVSVVTSVFLTDLLPPIITETVAGLGEIDVTWTNQSSYDNLLILYSTSAVYDRDTWTIIDLGSGVATTANIPSLADGVTYYVVVVGVKGSKEVVSNIVSDTTLDAFIFKVNTATAGGSGVGALLLPLSNTTTNFDLDIYVDDVYLRKVVNSAGRTLTVGELGAAEIKKITLVGPMLGWSFAGGGDRQKLTDIIRWGTFNHNNATGAFFGCTALKATITATDAPNFVGNGNTSVFGFFRGCTLFNTDIGHWDMSSITNTAQMFYLGASAFNNGGSDSIRNWDMSNVTDMNGMFYLATSFNQPIGDWDTSNVTNFQGVFQDATSFNQDISTWNTAKATTLQGIVQNANSFNQNIGAWNTLNTGGRTSITGTTALQSSSTANGINTANYDLFLVGQDAQVGTLATVAWGVSNRRYTIGGAGETARTSLLGRGVTFVGDAGI